MRARTRLFRRDGVTRLGPPAGSEVPGYSVAPSSLSPPRRCSTSIRSSATQRCCRASPPGVGSKWYNRSGRAINAGSTAVRFRSTAGSTPIWRCASSGNVERPSPFGFRAVRRRPTAGRPGMMADHLADRTWTRSPIRLSDRPPPPDSLSIFPNAIYMRSVREYLDYARFRPLISVNGPCASVTGCWVRLSRTWGSNAVGELADYGMNGVQKAVIKLETFCEGRFPRKRNSSEK